MTTIDDTTRAALDDNAGAIDATFLAISTLMTQRGIERPLRRRLTKIVALLQKASDGIADLLIAEEEAEEREAKAAEREARAEAKARARAEREAARAAKAEAKQAKLAAKQTSAEAPVKAKAPPAKKAKAAGAAAHA